MARRPSSPPTLREAHDRRRHGPEVLGAGAARGQRLVRLGVVVRGRTRAAVRAWRAAHGRLARRPVRRACRGGRCARGGRRGGAVRPRRTWAARRAAGRAAAATRGCSSAIRASSRASSIEKSLTWARGRRESRSGASSGAMRRTRMLIAPPRRREALEHALDHHERLGAHGEAVALVDLRRDDDVHRPVSSSSSRKTTPLAVPGRWRATTRPPTRTRAPWGRSLEVGAGGDPARRQPVAQEAQRVAIDGEAGRRVVGDHRVPVVEWRQLRRRGQLEPERELRAPRPRRVGGRGDAQAPQRRPATAGQRVAGARPRQLGQRRASGAARAARSSSERKGPPASRAATSAATSSPRTPRT